MDRNMKKKWRQPEKFWNIMKSRAWKWTCLQFLPTVAVPFLPIPRKRYQSLLTESSWHRQAERRYLPMYLFETGFSCPVPPVWQIGRASCREGVEHDGGGVP